MLQGLKAISADKETHMDSYWCLKTLASAALLK